MSSHLIARNNFKIKRSDEKIKTKEVALKTIDYFATLQYTTLPLLYLVLVLPVRSLVVLYRP